MHKIKIIRETLKGILLDELKASKKLSREQVEEIARDHGYVPESATRCLRSTGGQGVPVKKLNQFKKPIAEKGDRICWFKWDGGTRVVFNKK
jgi:hypothetical protein